MFMTGVITKDSICVVFFIMMNENQGEAFPGVQKRVGAESHFSFSQPL